jgi:hypothetical protein
MSGFCSTLFLLHLSLQFTTKTPIAKYSYSPLLAKNLHGLEFLLSGNGATESGRREDGELPELG